MGDYGEAAMDLRVVVSIAPADLATAVAAARAVVTPAAGEQPDVQADLSVVHCAQVGLMRRVARQKFGMPDADSWTPTPGGPTCSWTRSSCRGGPQGGSAALATAPPSSKDPRKIKMNAVINQTDEGEIPPLTNEERRELWHALQARKGGEIRPDTEPMDDQIAATKMKVVEPKLSPYADFAPSRTST